MKKRTILLFRLFLFLLILLVCGATALFKSKDYFDQYSNSNSIWDTSLLEYDVKQTSLSFKQLWTMPNVFILVDSLTLGESEIYFLGSLDKNIAPSLVNLNASTGQFKWQMENEPYTNTGLFSNHRYVFASFTGDGRIVAYDLETGVKAFDIQPPGAKTSRILSATESEILVTTSGDNRVVP